MKSSLVSLTIHVVVFALLMLYGTREVIARTRPAERSILIYRAPPPPVDHQAHFGTARSCNCTVAPNTVPPEIPPLRGLDTGSVIIDEPIVGPAFGASSSPTAVGSRHDSTGVLSADVVDVQVAPYPGAPAPRYPDALREAGIEGEVALEFVVDTMGRADLASVRVLSSPADAFVVSVRDALGGTRYHPALVGGRRVRQLVRQGFVFSLTQH